jgi:hypothetical protein
VNQRIVPFPAIASGKGPFDVRPYGADRGGQSSEPLGKRPGSLWVPLGSTCDEELGVREHEYGHFGLRRRRLISRSLTADLERGSCHWRWIQTAYDPIVNRYAIVWGNAHVVHLRPWQGQTPEDRCLAAMCHIRCEGLDMASAGRSDLVAAARFDADDVRSLEGAAAMLWACADGTPLKASRLLGLILSLQQRFGIPAPEPRARAIISYEDPRPIAWHIEPGELDILEPPLTTSLPAKQHEATTSRGFQRVLSLRVARGAAGV